MSQIPDLPTPRGRRTGPFPLVRACGCLFLVIGGLVFAGLMMWMNSTLTTDSGRVMATADQVLPGASLLPGQVGLFAVESQGRQLAVLGDPALVRRTGDAPAEPAEAPLTVLQSLEPDGDPLAEVAARLRTRLEERGYLERGMTVVDKASVPLLLGEGEALVTRTLLRAGGGGERAEFLTSLRGPGGPVLLMFEGPADRLGQQQVETFLAGLRGVAPEAPPSASPPMEGGPPASPGGGEGPP